LDLNFNLPNYGRELHSSLRYIDNIISDQSQGSLYHYLFEKGFVQQVGSQIDYTGEDNSILFTICLSLTNKGFKEYRRLPQLVMSYLQMLKNTELHKWYHDEMKTQSEIDFKYHLKEQPYDYVEGIVSNFGVVKDQKVLVHGFECGEFSPERIREQLGFLEPKNCFLVLCSSEFEWEGGYKVDPHYKTKWKVQDMDKALIKTMEVLDQADVERFAYPPQNIYIPKNFDLLFPKSDQEVQPQPQAGEKQSPKKKGKKSRKASEQQKPSEAEVRDTIKEEHPVKILEESDCEVWYKPDRTYAEPRAGVWMQVYHYRDGSQVDPLQFLYGEIWGTLLCIHFQDEDSRATAAGIGNTIEIDQHGISFGIFCYNDSLMQYVNKLAEGLVSFRGKTPVHHFDSVLEDLKESWTNSLTDDPKSQCNRYMKAILTENIIPWHFIIESLPKLTYAGYQEFLKTKIWEELYFQCYFGGNVTKDTSIEIYRKLKSTFYSYKTFKPLAKSEIIHFPTSKLPESKTLIYKKFLTNEDENNSCIHRYYQLAAPQNLAYSAQVEWSKDKNACLAIIGTF
jgi:secreted Zn-dependent insulinase-like peptidase